MNTIISILPKNPRIIRDARFEALKKSIEDAPEMLNLRELLVYPLENGNYIVIGGNMRPKACLDLGYKELPCKIIASETPIEKLKEYIIKDNVAFGQNNWEDLNIEWDRIELENWGMEVPLESTELDIDDFFNEVDNIENKKAPKEEITITLLEETIEDKEEIKEIIKDVLKDYKVKIK